MDLTAGSPRTLIKEERIGRCSTWTRGTTIAVLSVVALVVVAVTKTLWTKAMFSTLEFHFPVTSCIISCVVTVLVLLPFFLLGGARLLPIPAKHRTMFAVITLFTTADLACMNLGLDLLSVSVQQALNATTPAAVILFELILYRKVRSVWVYLPFIPLIAGSVLTTVTSGER
eukprot:1392527-Amorphochlora_amoeboformis.AAC.2